MSGLVSLGSVRVCRFWNVQFSFVGFSCVELRRLTSVPFCLVRLRRLSLGAYGSVGLGSVGHGV